MKNYFENEKKIKGDIYKNDGHYSKKIFLEYYNQIALCRKIFEDKKLNEETAQILEIGIGAKVTNSILRNLYKNVTSADINEHLNPDLLINLADDNITFPNQYHLILCAEIIEHIPFEYLDTVFANLHNALQENGTCIITIPECCRIVKFNIDIPKIHIHHNIFLKRKGIDPNHAWELGSHDYSKKEILIKKMCQYFNIIKHDHLDENPQHYYFILEKGKKYDTIKK